MLEVSLDEQSWHSPPEHFSSLQCPWTKGVRVFHADRVNIPDSLGVQESEDATRPLHVKTQFPGGALQLLRAFFDQQPSGAEKWERCEGDEVLHSGGPGLSIQMPVGAQSIFFALWPAAPRTDRLGLVASPARTRFRSPLRIDLSPERAAARVDQAAAVPEAGAESPSAADKPAEPCSRNARLEHLVGKVAVVADNCRESRDSAERAAAACSSSTTLALSVPISSSDEDELTPSQFPRAARECLAILEKDGEIDGEERDYALELLRCLSKALGKGEEKQRLEARRHEEERNSLSAQLASAKETAGTLRKKTVVLEAQVRAERQLRSGLESEVAQLNLRLQRQVQEVEHLERENAALRQWRREREPAIRESRKQRCDVDMSLARQIAELECQPLRQADSAEKQALKKRLVLKWHPDKQPSSDHANLATQVMQEMQNHSDWA